MSTTVERNGQSLVDELRNWMGLVANPSIRIEEFVDGDRRVVRADIPGVDPTKDIELSVDGNVLRLRGERRAEEHDLHHTEIRYGSFERVVSMPPGTTAEDVAAEYVDGVLTVTMPMRAPVASSTIPITHRELPAE
ncbi:Hsp20/alpha crystallin family protein [Nocardioides soli]|uniref:HSP20 family protein n=1 Tax=Nocardioides soli TaxID=1036020 RepID=A0A7W4Z3I9_9ACTN|nr:Hsp20/alpha crystallin family protein [Nocardioides soli]MBB3043760.1 HSP20 family protein [Nocardioides soli]